MARFQRGDQLNATVEEVINSTDLIVAVAGVLYGVQNQTGSRFNKGDQIQLIVRRESPLEFQLLSREKDNFRLDRII